jgi:hypothetical protein
VVIRNAGYWNSDIKYLLHCKSRYQQFFALKGGWMRNYKKTGFSHAVDRYIETATTKSSA